MRRDTTFNKRHKRLGFKSRGLAPRDDGGGLPSSCLLKSVHEVERRGMGEDWGSAIPEPYYLDMSFHP